MAIYIAKRAHETERCFECHADSAKEAIKRLATNENCGLSPRDNGGAPAYMMRRVEYNTVINGEIYDIEVYKAA